MHKTLRLSLAFLLASGACGAESPSEPSGGGPPASRGEVHVVFVGNSLTYTHDVPGFVRTIAEVAGESFTYRTVAFPGVSLEDHWLDGTALRIIREERPDVVILQQGPSSTPQNQLHLREWAGRFAEVARDAGAWPGMYMVWPEATRMEAFDQVSASYTEAAEAVGGLLFPVGEAWRAVWRRDPDAALYGPDGFHPSAEGAVVAALTIFRVLFDHPVTALPRELRSGGADLPEITLEASEAEDFYAAVEEAVERFGRH